MSDPNNPANDPSDVLSGPVPREWNAAKKDADKAGKSPFVPPLTDAEGNLLPYDEYEKRREEHRKRLFQSESERSSEARTVGDRAGERVSKRTKVEHIQAAFKKRQKKAQKQARRQKAATGGAAARPAKGDSTFVGLRF